MALSRTLEDSVRPSLRHPLLALLGVVLAPALWIVLVASGNIHELLLGALASLLTLLFVLFVCRSSGTEITLRARDVLEVWRVPGYILYDIYVISVIALKDLLGRKRAGSLYRVCGFDTSTHDPVREARTILAVVYTTASPNFIVIGVDPAQSRMLFHQLGSSEVPEMTRALGAKG